MTKSNTSNNNDDATKEQWVEIMGTAFQSTAVSAKAKEKNNSAIERKNKRNIQRASKTKRTPRGKKISHEKGEQVTTSTIKTNLRLECIDTDKDKSLISQVKNFLEEQNHNHNWEQVLIENCCGSDVSLLIKLVDDKFNFLLISGPQRQFPNTFWHSISDALKHNNQINTLSFEHAHMQKAHLQILGEALSNNNCNLKVLTFDLCTIRDQDISAFGRGLGSCKSLEKLKIKQCGLQDPPMGILLDAMAKSVSLLPTSSTSSLKEFNLVGNYIGVSGLEALSELLQHENCNITKLDLSYQHTNPANQVTYQKFFEGAIEKNQSLTSLWLTQNGIKETDIPFLISALEHNNKLSYLNLAWCVGLTDAGVIKLASCLGKHASLKRVDLVSRNFGEEGCKALVEALKTNPKLYSVGCRPHQFAFSSTSVDHPVRESILHYQRFNYGGRQILSEMLKNDNNNVPLGLWSKILERADKKAVEDLDNNNASPLQFQHPYVLDLSVVYCLIRDGLVCTEFSQQQKQNNNNNESTKKKPPLPPPLQQQQPRGRKRKVTTTTKTKTTKRTKKTTS